MFSVNSLLDNIGYLFSPPICGACRKKLQQRSFFCSECMQKIRPIASHNVVVTCKKSVCVHAISSYNPLLRPLILQKRRKVITGSYALAQLIWQRTPFKQLDCDYLVPIPLHWTRMMARGFNQANEMAIILAKKKGVSVKHLIKRVGRTNYQADLPIDKREENVVNAFKLAILPDDYKSYRNKHLFLVDDLMTTGNTLKYAARQLFKLRPASVSVLVACRAI